MTSNGRLLVNQKMKNRRRAISARGAGITGVGPFIDYAVMPKKSCLSPALLLMAHLKNILQGKLHDSGVHRTSDLPESIAIVQGRRIADGDASPDGGNSGKA